jgi:hypothetical protein
MNKIITIKGHEVMEVYESFDGNYWFITQKCHRQNSIVGGKVYKNDLVFYGYIKLAACPGCAGFDYVSKGQLELIGAWKIPKTNWEYLPDIEVVDVPDYFSAGNNVGSKLANSYSKNCKEVGF